MKFSSETELRSPGSARVLVIMAKAPRAGAVKTRLIPSLSPQAVIDFYCCLLEDTLALARSLSGVDVAIMCPGSDVVAFNSDSPHLPRSVLEDAFETLAARDLVVGPTHDGGYYLVGAKASNPALFIGDGMGTSSALERLLSRARALDLSVGFAIPFYDIDVADDLTRLAAELRLASARAPRTAQWLKAWELAESQLRSGSGGL